MPEIRLECIGDDIAQAIRAFDSKVSTLTAFERGHQWQRRFRSARTASWPEPFVWQVVGISERGSLMEERLRGRKDYTHANSVGSRGVYLWYSLVRGEFYRIQSIPSWKRSHVFYAVATADGYAEMSEQEVRACLSGGSASMS